jgi:hypothetical protein
MYDSLRLYQTGL